MLRRRPSRSGSGESGEQRRVLVTGGNHTGPLAAVRALEQAGYLPWVTASSRTAYAGRSRAVEGVVLVPDVRDDRGGFVDAVVDACPRLGVDVLLPGTDAELVALASERHRLGSLAASLPSRETALRVTSKQALSELGAAVGLPIPRTTVIDSALDNHERTVFPVVIKPVRSATETPHGFVDADVHVIRSYSELVALVPTLVGHGWLIQPLLRGRLGAVCGVAWRGEVVCAVHQLCERIWPPDVGVSAYARTVPRDKAIEGSVATVVGEYGWSGLFQAQFIHTGDHAYLIDFNPRVYGSLSLAVAAGANLPAVWARLVLGDQTLPPSDYEVGFRYRSEMRDLAALRQMIISGRVADACRGIVPRRRTTHELGRLSDPLPLMAAPGVLGRSYWSRRFPRSRPGRQEP